MNKRVFIVTSVAVTLALAAGFSSTASADDSSLDPFTGDSYAAFNGGNLEHVSKAAVFVNTPSSWRQANPNGLSEHRLQTLSSEALASTFEKSTFEKGPSTWRQAHPSGLSQRELQALSSPGPAWQSSRQLGPSALAIIKFRNRVSD